MRESLGQIEAKLDPARFARAHRSAIVNLSRVTSLNPLTAGEYIITLTTATRLTLSRGCRDSGDNATIRAYFDAQSDPNGFENALGRYHLSRGYDLLRVELVPNRGELVAGTSATELPEMRTTSRSG